MIWLRNGSFDYIKASCLILYFINHGLDAIWQIQATSIYPQEAASNSELLNQAHNYTCIQSGLFAYRKRLAEIKEHSQDIVVRMCVQMWCVMVTVVNYVL